MADVTGVLMHYPFVSTFQQKVEDAVRTGRYGGTTSEEYVRYGKELARNPRLRLKRSSARRFTGLEPLIADGFLVVSDDYVRWVRRPHERPGATAGRLTRSYGSMRRYTVQPPTAVAYAASHRSANRCTTGSV